MVKHFGVNVRNKEGGLKLTEDNYTHITIRKTFDKSVYYSLEEIEVQFEIASPYFKLSMRYFSSLNNSEFRDFVSKYTQSFNFTEIVDLNTLQDVSGYYLLVLDDYSQVYLGISKNMKKRIMAHWSREIPLDHLIFSHSDGRPFSIDSFRALDTTRIYALYDDFLYSEYKMMSKIPMQFLLNTAFSGIFETPVPNILERIRERNMVRDLSLFED